MTAQERPLDKIVNHTFDELAVGDSAGIERTLTGEDLRLFALLAGQTDAAAPEPAPGSARRPTTRA